LQAKKLFGFRQELVIPLALEIIKKPIIVSKETLDKEGNKITIQTRKSIKTKNQLVQENIRPLAMNFF